MPDQAEPRGAGPAADAGVQVAGPVLVHGEYGGTGWPSGCEQAADRSMDAVGSARDASTGVRGSSAQPQQGHPQDAGHAAAQQTVPEGEPWAPASLIAPKARRAHLAALIAGVVIALAGFVELVTQPTTTSCPCEFQALHFPPHYAEPDPTGVTDVRGESFGFTGVADLPNQLRLYTLRGEGSPDMPVYAVQADRALAYEATFPAEEVKRMRPVDASQSAQKFVEADLAAAAYAAENFDNLGAPLDDFDRETNARALALIALAHPRGSATALGAVRDDVKDVRDRAAEIVKAVKDADAPDTLAPEVPKTLEVSGGTDFFSGYGYMSASVVLRNDVGEGIPAQTVTLAYPGGRDSRKTGEDGAARFFVPITVSDPSVRIVASWEGDYPAGTLMEGTRFGGEDLFDRTVLMLAEPYPARITVGARVPLFQPGAQT